LRLKELMRLRIKDIDIDRRQITIRQGKGDLDRVRGGGRAGGGALAVQWLPGSQRPATAGLPLNTPPLRARTMDEHERGRCFGGSVASGLTEASYSGPPIHHSTNPLIHRWGARVNCWGSRVRGLGLPLSGRGSGVGRLGSWLNGRSSPLKNGFS